jgi:integrase
MRRRLIGAFDGGLRRGEMLLLQIKHVDWTLKYFTPKDGARIPYYEIVLPPTITKGGRSTGKLERVYAATPRFREMLEQRRFQLRRRRDDGRMEPDPEAYVFGTEAGKRQKSFDDVWHRLFGLADVRWGRDVGIVWHTIRHEFISRMVELCQGDLSVAKELARHRRIETTEVYMKARESRKVATVAALAR